VQQKLNGLAEPLPCPLINLDIFSEFSSLDPSSGEYFILLICKKSL
jgi:hypothetical protein